MSDDNVVYLKKSDLQLTNSLPFSTPLNKGPDPNSTGAVTGEDLQRSY